MDTDAPGPSGPELREYTALLRRRWRLVCAGVLSGLVLATAAVFGLPSTYTSIAAVQVQPTGMGEFTGERSGRLAGEVNLDTEAQVLVSDQVSSAVAQTLAGTGTALTTRELREHVDVSVPPNSNVLEISYSATSPEGARAGAEAYADAYLDLRRTQVDDLIGSHLEALRDEQEQRYEALAEVAFETPSLPGTDVRVEALHQEIAELGNEISPLSALRETVEPGRVITPADLPEGPSNPVPALWLVSGAALGLVAGLLAAVARDRLDPRLHGTEDTARIGALPVLLDLSGGGGRGDRFPGLLAESDHQGQRVNEFAHLVRARLTTAPAAPSAVVVPQVPGADRAAESGGAAESAGFLEADDGAVPGRVLVVAATTPGRAGTAAAVNLATALARTGSETLLVCTEPHADTVGELLGLPEGPGLAEALLEGDDPAGLEVRPDPVPRLRVLRYGCPGMGAPVQGTAMPELMRLLRTDTEYVVVAVGPVSERADAHALAGLADLLLPVVELGRTRRTDLTGLLTLAERFGVPCPGTAVLPRQPLAGPANELPPSTARSHGGDRGEGIPAGAVGASGGSGKTGAGGSAPIAGAGGTVEPGEVFEVHGGAGAAEAMGAIGIVGTGQVTGVSGAAETMVAFEVLDVLETAEAAGDGDGDRDGDSVPPEGGEATGTDVVEPVDTAERGSGENAEGAAVEDGSGSSPRGGASQGGIPTDGRPATGARS